LITRIIFDEKYRSQSLTQNSFFKLSRSNLFSVFKTVCSRNPRQSDQQTQQEFIRSSQHLPYTSTIQETVCNYILWKKLENFPTPVTHNLLRNFRKKKKKTKNKQVETKT
jgi:hypothetical protein